MYTRLSLMLTRQKEQSEAGLLRRPGTGPSIGGGWSL